MKNSAYIFFLLFTVLSCSSTTKVNENQNEQKAVSFYDHELTTIFYEPFDMEQLKGKKVMVVNTASSCGLTPQYADLQTLYNKHGESGFIILGFPSNSFENQEPRDNEEIQEFCEKNYGVTFPIMLKTDVIGKDQHPLFRWLTTKELNGKMDVQIKNAFYKFMINPDGSLEGYVESEIKPTNHKIVSWLKK